MLICQICGKGRKTIAFSRHKKGSSGAGGNWALRAPIHKKLQKPNLHKYHGLQLCSSCLKLVKKASVVGQEVKTAKTTEQTSAVQA